MGVVGPALVIASFATDKQGLSGGYWVALCGLIFVWIWAMLDIFVRHLWLYSDRIVSRNAFFQIEEIRYQNVAQLLNGENQTVVQSFDGKSITILGKMASYERAVGIIALATGIRI